MIPSKMNQVGNANNEYQGDTKKILCVCSAGLLRSPTMAHYLSKTYGFNTRACGTSEDYALVPISQALAKWADEIHCVQEQYQEVLRGLEQFNIEGKKVIYLDIPDSYSYNDPDLLSQIEAFYGIYFQVLHS
jgi:predicted protein tyrosine phosphatase